MAADLAPRKIIFSTSEVISAPPSEIWPYLAAIGGERLLIPGCTKSSLLSGQGEGAIRRIHFGDAIFDERVLECNFETFKLWYEVLEPHPSPAKGVAAVVQLHSYDLNKTTITWTSAAESVPPEHEKHIKEQAKLLCEGQISSLRRLVESDSSIAN